MAEPSDSLHFLRWFTGFILAGVVLVIIFVAVVDPYDQYRFVVRPGFNLIKPGLTRYQNEIKLTKVDEIQPNVLILGNSRAEVGFDPDASVFAREGMAAYNLAIPGAGIGTAREQMEYLHQTGFRPEIIILGLEFLDFVETPQQRTASSAPQVRPKGESHPITQWFWRFDSLFSLAAVSDAIRTLLIQHDEEAETITSRGFNPLKQYRPIVRNEGYYGLFQQRAQENTQLYLKKARGSLAMDDFAHLHAILDIAAESGSEVKLIIYPYHAQILALFEETGLWLAFEEWKSLLTREISAARKRHPSARFTLFDFSGYGSYNCERIPEKGDRRMTTRWYWEAGHFKKELGDVVLESVFSRSTNPLEIAHIKPDKSGGIFGSRLDESISTLALNSQRIYHERLECIRTYPELFAEAVALVNQANNRH